ncbi:TIGR03826 family flagellar region protein [Calidifontibacillus oryziterrae]|uniref:TIGR03826 family flagellar region protein n=1 Tax=Calidifontibacillus oryziterrae TaxID=1191699 RepID=UPI000315E643|nr:TIGR03826 family flagellar region protein [Calidifontibacillus oryziterrae]
MPELDNCPKCGRLYVRNIHGICDVCRKEEDKLFEKVYEFIRKRENRTAGIAQIVEATGVSEDTIMRFVKEGRLRTTQFPNLGYRCERCGRLINKGKLCQDCLENIQSDLKAHTKTEEIRKKREEAEKKAAHTYYSVDTKIKRD